MDEILEGFYEDGLRFYRYNNSLESKHPFNQFIKTYVESRVILKSTEMLCESIKENKSIDKS